MKSKNLKQKQAQFRQKINQQNPKDNQNIHKLANLFNLSQINIKSNDYNLAHSINSSAVIPQFRNIQAHYPNSSLKNIIPLQKRYNNHSQSNLNTGLLFQGNQINKHNENGQQSPSYKNFKNPKAKRCKSYKKNLLSCQQILDITRKRDTYAVVPFQSNKNNTIIYNHTKTKKKGKKQIIISNNQTKNANTLKISGTTGKIAQQYCSLNSSKTINHLGEESNSNFVVNYPLSLSHSFIVFSDKDSTMNNTTKILSKKLSASTQNKLLQLHQKLQKIKVEHAAIIIQKNWRGYLTRKLLQDYIKSQQMKLLNKLTNIKAQKIQYEKFSRLSPGCNNFWSNQGDYCPQISGIFQKDTQNQIQIKEKEDHQQIGQLQPFLPIAGKKINKQQENQNNKTIRSYEQQDQDHYQKRSPIINGDFIQKQVLESIQLFQRSICITSRNQDHPVSMQESKKNCGKSTNLHLQEKSIYTQPSSRNVVRCNKKLIISKQFQQIIMPSNTNNKSLMTNSDLQKEFNSFQINVKQIFDLKIEKYQRYLSDQVKNSQIQFNALLQTRQYFKEVKRVLTQRISQFFKGLQCLLMQIPSSYPKTINQQKVQQTKVSKLQAIKIQPSDKSNGKENDSFSANSNRRELGSRQRFSSKKLIANYFQQCQQLQSEQILSDVKKILSPVSEYFTIQLPTQQLSPHKRPLSSGLQSLKTYFYNLNQEYLQQYQNQNETKFLCKVLKKHSQMGPQNMIQRCLIQMLVEILTCQYSLQDILLTIQNLTNQVQNIEQNILVIFVRKWADQLDKWQLGPIQQVSRNMQESADVTERNHTSKKKRKILELQSQYFQVE